MTASAPDGRLYVVVGILKDKKGRLFVQQRRSGTPKAGKWEFPGGKLESNETPWEALSRELHEELGILVVSCEKLTVVTHDYDHAKVWLDTYLVTEFEGNPVGREGQAFSWVDIKSEKDLSRFDFLPAVFPIIEALRVADTASAG
ncbi:MAG: (deoxy)nucleoside triphosphate pyrophosphohydrolase [Acidiferrobacterales bacterium]|nr:(deoxy)nucleoside triphosphate pyrophosphohydrolase [Acidiferrobacterales bacterium]